MPFKVENEHIHREHNFYLHKIKTEMLPKYLLTDFFSQEKNPNWPTDG